MGQVSLHFLQLQLNYNYIKYYQITITSNYSKTNYNYKIINYSYNYNYICGISNKKLSYRRGTAQCVVSVEILPTATQQCRNYLYDQS